MRVWLAAALMLAATACASGPGTDCAGFKPIRPTSADVDMMSDRLVAEILAHNEFGRAHCGWRR